MKYYIFAYDTKSCIDYRIQNSIIKAKMIFICFLFIYLQRFSKKKSRNMRHIRKYRSFSDPYQYLPSRIIFLQEHDTHRGSGRENFGFLENVKILQNLDESNNSFFRN